MESSVYFLTSVYAFASSCPFSFVTFTQSLLSRGDFTVPFTPGSAFFFCGMLPETSGLAEMFELMKVM